MRCARPRVWLPINNFYSNPNIRCAHILSAKLSDCWQHLMFSKRIRKGTSSIFCTRSSRFVKAKFASSQPLRQGSLNRISASPKISLPQSPQRHIIHRSPQWTPNFLATQRSFKLLGPSLHPRHTTPTATVEAQNFDGFKHESRQSLLTAILNGASSKRQLDTFSRLKVFSNYLKLRHTNLAPITFARLLLPKSRRPRITAYLFVGLRRPPVLTFSSPLRAFWRSFRKFQKPTYSKRSSKNKTPATARSVRYFLGTKISKTLNRSRSSLNRSWALSLLLPRSPSLYTQSLKENTACSALVNHPTLTTLYQNDIRPSLNSRQLRRPTLLKLSLSDFRLRLKSIKTRRLAQKKLKRSLNKTTRSYTPYWLRRTRTLRSHKLLSKLTAVAVNLRTTVPLATQESTPQRKLLPAIQCFTRPSHLSNIISSTKGSQHLSLPVLRCVEYGNSLFLKSNLPSKSDLILEPSYSPLFALSPFGFLGYILTSPLKIMDVLRSTVNYSPSVNYLVFPDANAVKTSIFRRLNRQKFLSSARSSLYHQSVVGGTSTRFVQGSSYWPSAPSIPTNRRTKITTAATLSFTKNWTTRRLIESIAPPANKSPRIRRIRFKPGYNRIWRLARTSARELLGITSRYQYRLTPKIQREYYQNRLSPDIKLSLTVEFALLTANFIPDHWSLKEILNSHNVFLNGRSCVNPKLRLFCSDFLQLVVGLQYYAMSRWLASWSTQKKGRVSKTFYRKFKPSTFNKNIKLVRRLPDWFYDLQYTYTDIPKYFEVDYFTLSIFLIHDNISQERWLPNRADQMNYSFINMYNWKYIT